MKYLIIFALLTSFSAIAQKTNPVSKAAQAVLQGKVLDSINHEPVPGATVIVNRFKDNTQLGAVVTDMEGEFVIDNLPKKDSLTVDIRFLGYKPYLRLLYLKEPVFVMAPALLQEGAMNLKEVLVKGTVPPMAIRGDTLEYHVPSYTTRPHSQIGDLIKKLPGLEVNRDGSMTHNGQRISKILVDGREYFGEDGRMALSTLPVEVVQKIQVMETEEQKRSGSLGEKSKTLNIQLKQDLKDFGSLAAGAGTDHRYELMGKWNRFRGNSRLTLLGMYNNINVVDYREEEAIALLNAGNGITKTITGGANYSNRWKSGIEISTGYNYTHPNTFQESIKQRTQFIVPDSSFYTNSNSTTTRISKQHHVNINSTIPLDSISNLSFQMPFTHRSTNDRTTSHTITTNEGGNKVNELESNYISNGEHTSIPFYLQWKKGFIGSDANLNISLSGNFSNRKNEDLNLVETTFFNNESESTSQLRQQILMENTTKNYGLRVRYFFPISASFNANLGSNTSYNRASNSRETWNLNAENEQESLDSLSTNAFRSKNLNSTTDFSLDYKTKKLEISTGATLNYNYQNSFDLSLQSAIDQDFLNVSPSVRINYKISDKKNLGINYNTYTSSPSLTQLQPVRDNTNPLFIQVGNPDLNPVFNQTFSLNYYAINNKGVTFFSNVMYALVQDQIINTITYDELGRQISGYTNVNGVKKLFGYFGFSGRKKGETEVLGLKVSGNVGYNRDINFIQSQLVASDRWTFAPNIGLNYDIEKVLGMEISYIPEYNSVSYDKATGQNQDFIIHRISGSFDLYPTKNLILGNNIGFIRNNSLPADFEKTSLLWNMDLSYLFLKDNSGELKFRVFDLLKRNRNINRIATQNYIEDTQSNNLQQYFMLSFGYHFK